MFLASVIKLIFDSIDFLFLIPSVIKGSSGILDVRLGEVIDGMVIKLGLVLDVFVGNALVGMYGKCGVVSCNKTAKI